MAEVGRSSEAERHFPADPTSAAAARAFIADQVRGLQIDPARLVLLTSELVTNSLVHACTEVVVRIRCSPLPIRVEVEDCSLQAPVLIEATPEETSGRGVQMVDLLSSSWGWNLLPSGKRVWFELAQTPQSCSATGLVLSGLLGRALLDQRRP